MYFSLNNTTLANDTLTQPRKLEIKKVSGKASIYFNLLPFLICKVSPKRASNRTDRYQKPQLITLQSSFFSLQLQIYIVLPTTQNTCDCWDVSYSYPSQPLYTFSVTLHMHTPSGKIPTFLHSTHDASSLQPSLKDTHGTGSQHSFS